MSGQLFQDILNDGDRPLRAQRDSLQLSIRKEVRRKWWSWSRSSRSSRALAQPTHCKISGSRAPRPQALPSLAGVREWKGKEGSAAGPKWGGPAPAPWLIL